MKKEKISIISLKRELGRLKRLVYHDSLTGLYNRKGFAEDALGYLKELKSEQARNRREFKINNFSVIFIDLNDFKKLNDKHGHPCGDKTIVAFAAFLKKSVRSFDIVCRWSGDEFVVGLVGAGLKEAAKIAGKIKNLVAVKNWRLCGKNLKLSVSLGVASAIDRERKPQSIFKLESLIEEADRKMYQDKKREKSLFKLNLF